MKLLTSRAALVAALFIGAAGVIAGASALRPAVAAVSFDTQSDAVVKCSTSGACQVYHNTGTGQGLEGETAKGTGLFGVATKTGTGVKGTSVSGVGVIGQTMFNSTSPSNERWGVLGQDLSTSGIYDVGVIGLSSLGTGLAGNSTSGVGVSGASTNAGGVFGVSTNLDGVEGNGYRFGGYFLTNTGSGVYAQTMSNAHPALIANAGDKTAVPSSTIAVVTVGFNGSSQSCTGTYDVFSIDQKGDVLACGSITAHTGPLVITRTSVGQPLISYSAQQSQPTIEDFGQGHLVNGQAYVAIEPKFASTIDPRSHYLIFLTPYGDNRGLYVSQQTPAGFAVRESQGGRSALGFDYRILARPIDNNAPRLPLASSLPHPRSENNSQVRQPMLRQQLPQR